MTTGSATTTPRAVAVSIVNYRTAELVIAGLPALLEELSHFAEARVVIVDNASGGGDAEAIQAAIARNGWAPRVSLVHAPHNGGFAAGNNLAFAEIARWAQRPLGILLLNPDAEVRPGAVRALAALLGAHPAAGAAGACQEHPDGRRWSGAFRFPGPMSEFARASGIGRLAQRFHIVHGMCTAPRRVDWVSGAAVMIRPEALESVGAMDEGFFLYFEEVDLMRRLADAGWETWHTPEAVIRHDAGQSTGIRDGMVRRGRMPAYWFASWLRYFVKAHGPAYARTTAAIRLMGLVLSCLVAALKGRQHALPERYVADFARHCLLAPLPRPDADARR